MASVWRHPPYGGSLRHPPRPRLLRRPVAHPQTLLHQNAAESRFPEHCVHPPTHVGAHVQPPFPEKTTAGRIALRYTPAPASGESIADKSARLKLSQKQSAHHRYCVNGNVLCLCLARDSGGRPPPQAFGSRHFGDCEPVGDGVLELREDLGVGYRVYFGRHGQRIVILLCGRTKKTAEH